MGEGGCVVCMVSSEVCVGVVKCNGGRFESVVKCVVHMVSSEV